MKNERLTNAERQDKINSLSSELRISLASEIFTNSILLLIIYSNLVNSTIREATPDIFLGALVNLGLRFVSLSVSKELKFYSGKIISRK